MEPAHYPIVGGVLIDTLQDALGEAFTTEARNAWSGAFAQIAAIMSAEPEVMSVEKVDSPAKPSKADRVIQFPQAAAN